METQPIIVEEPILKKWTVHNAALDQEIALTTATLNAPNIIREPAKLSTIPTIEETRLGSDLLGMGAFRRVVFLSQVFPALWFCINSLHPCKLATLVICPRHTSDTKKITSTITRKPFWENTNLSVGSWKNISLWLDTLSKKKHKKLRVVWTLKITTLTLTSGPCVLKMCQSGSVASN